MIKCNPSINFGQPALVGRRLTVYDIVTKFYYEANVDIVLEDYQIGIDDGFAAVDYCKNLRCREDKELIHYCDGCVLRTIAEGWNFKSTDYLEVVKNGQSFVFSMDEKEIFAGTLKEFEDSEFGKVTWLIAEEVNDLIKRYK